MTQRSGSQWAVQRRCLAIIRRVQQGGATWEDLAEAVSQQEGDEVYNQLEDEPLREAISRDVKRIRDNLNINISYNRTEGAYQYQPDEGMLPLLDLPDEDLATMIWLERVFPPNTPMHEGVSDFMKRLRLFLDPERMTKIAQKRLEVDLRQLDDNRIDPELMGRLQRAIDRRQQVEFEYESYACEPGFLERHRLNIYEDPYFESGHYYVRGWSHYVVYKGKRDNIRDYRFFRFDRIRRLEVLSLKFPEESKKSRWYTVCYRLPTYLARHGITRHRWIIIERIEEQEKTVIVHGKTTSTFWAKQTLLHYGRTCTVLGGTELLKEYKKEVAGMARKYLEEANNG